MGSPYRGLVLASLFVALLASGCTWFSRSSEPRSEAGVIDSPPSFRRITSFGLWIGVPMMVTSGLLLFFMNWKTMVRAFSTIGAFLKQSKATDDPMEKIEVPGSWFLGGFIGVGALAVLLGYVLNDSEDAEAAADHFAP